MRKRLVLSGLIALLACLALPAAASAHVLKVDGHIGAVLHINPDDNPTTGSPTDYIIYFDDDTNRFSLPKCNCMVSIIENGKTIATKPLTVSSSEVSENHFTFVRPAVYGMRFTGTPKQSGAFQPFTLDYEVRVTSKQTSEQPFPILLWVGLGLAIGLILLASYAMEYNNGEVTSKGRQ